VSDANEFFHLRGKRSSMAWICFKGVGCGSVVGEVESRMTRGFLNLASLAL